MLLQMAVRYGGSYNKEKNIFGLGNSLYNFIMVNNILEKEFERIHIVEVESICLLEDDKNLVENKLSNIGVCRIEISQTHDVPTKYATYQKTAEFLKNINNIFIEGEVKSITIKREKNAEIL